MCVRMCMYSRVFMYTCRSRVQVPKVPVGYWYNYCTRVPIRLRAQKVMS